MLKVKLNINEKEIKESSFIIINEIQKNNEMIIFPFYDRDIVQFVEIKKVGEWHQLELYSGEKEEEIIIKKQELGTKWWAEAIEKFLEFNNDIIKEYDKNTLKYLVEFLLNSYPYKYLSCELNDKKECIYRVELISTISLVFNVLVSNYGVVSFEGSIIDRELDKVICDNISFTLEKPVAEDLSNDELCDMFENIDEKYIYKIIINNLQLN